VENEEFEQFVHRMKVAPTHASTLAPLLEVFMATEY
jgi:hypothetical protein